MGLAKTERDVALWLHLQTFQNKCFLPDILDFIITISVTVGTEAEMKKKMVTEPEGDDSPPKK